MANPGADTLLYEAGAEASSDKLVLNGECTLIHDAGELLVTVAAIEGERLTLRCSAELPAQSSTWKLVVYPWFLYERLLLALESLPGSPAFNATPALTLFGKLQPVRTATSTRLAAPDLNASQQRAVQLCSDANVAFIWGPPGTGKTRTISHIVAELLAQGYRILITSTTHAAIDEALAAIVRHPCGRDLVDAGQVVRVGQAGAPTQGAALAEVLNRRNAALRRRLERLRTMGQRISARFQACAKALQKVMAATAGRQLDMFQQVPDDTLHSGDLGPVFGYRMASRILALMPEDKQAVIKRRYGRLERASAACRQRVDASLEALAGEEAAVVAQARVILATMTHMYISPLLKAEAFDVVIVEEAGMAVLPTLFYCAGLATRKVIAVGDPRQLPPIVQSRDAFAQRAMGRTIFDVTVPDLPADAGVVMLDTQYRMHPAIGSLVSDLFYAGRLAHAPSTSSRSDTAGKSPYPGEPLVVVDTAGTTRCTRVEGSHSRMNAQTAEFCVRLAVEAVANGIGSVAIITPYARQSRWMSRLLADQGLPDGAVECRTVHRFQGNERDMVIVDTVDTAPERPGVLLAGRHVTSSAPNLLNVGLSRARGKLVIVSDVAYFHARAPGSAMDRVLQAAIRSGVRVTLPSQAPP